VGREYAPVPGKWFENKEEEETFRVLSVDEDEELVEIEYLDGEIEEMDLDTWHELDLEPIEEPEGWSDEADDDEEDDDDLDEDEDDDDEDDDDDDDDDLDEEEEEQSNY
jgi:ribonuclease E